MRGSWRSPYCHQGCGRRIVLQPRRDSVGRIDLPLSAVGLEQRQFRNLAIATPARAKHEATRGLHNLRERAPWRQGHVTVEEVAALAVYLCSDAAKAITVPNLSIDGGWTAE